MKRELSPSAQVAKIIKKSITDRGYKCDAKSSNYSMGCSVSVNVYNMPPDVYKDMDAEFDCYEYGTFDGMTDCSGTKNRDFAGPQTKYLTITNHNSKELCQAAWDIIRTTFSDAMGAPESLEDARSFSVGGEWAPHLVWRMMSARQGDNWSMSKEFWDTHGAKSTIELKQAA